MNEEYEGSHTPVDLRKPQSGADGQDAFAAYQDQNGAQQGPAQDLPQEGIYKAGTHQKQGEYHDTSQDWNSTYSQEAKGQESRQAYEPVSQGFGIASLSIGIVSLLLFCTCINIPLAVLAVVFGILQLTKPGCKKGMAIGGIITSVLSIFLFMVFFIGFMGSINYQEDFQRQLQRSLERQFEDDYEDGYNDGYMDDYEDDYNDGYLDDYGYPSFDWDEDDGFKDGVMDDTF